jgi:hypothetical protein
LPRFLGIEEDSMSSKLSVAQVVSKLEAHLVFHRQQEAFHAQQEVHHREQRAVHAAELEKIQAQLEAFKSAAEPLEDLAEAPIPDQTPKAEAPDFGPGRPQATRVIRAVVESYGEGERFGANGVAAEVNRRHLDKLDGPVDGAAVSVVLRRMRSERKIHLVRTGKAHSESLYSRGPRPKG